MRIDNNRANLEALNTLKAQAAQGEKSGAAGQASKADGDKVRLSSGAQLATTAVSAAKDSPEIRPEAVERARKLLESGTLGADADRLADALIDRALTKNG